MMRYCNLKSEIRICQAFENFCLPDYCLCVSKCENGLCKIVIFDSPSGAPYKYCTTWVENLIPFQNDEEEKYRNIYQPKIIDIKCNSIQVCSKGKTYVLRLVDELTLVIGQRILVIDPTSTSFSKYGTIEDVISNMEYLVQNDFIPKYKIKLDNGELHFFDSYQIAKAS